MKSKISKLLAVLIVLSVLVPIGSVLADGGGFTTFLPLVISDWPPNPPSLVTDIPVSLEAGAEYRIHGPMVCVGDFDVFWSGDWVDVFYDDDPETVLITNYGDNLVTIRAQWGGWCTPIHDYDQVYQMQLDQGYTAENIVGVLLPKELSYVLTSAWFDGPMELTVRDFVTYDLMHNLVVGDLVYGPFDHSENLSFHFPLGCASTACDSPPNRLFVQADEVGQGWISGRVTGKWNSIDVTMPIMVNADETPTPEPTATATPTETPEPTSTPVPTATPTATPTTQVINKDLGTDEEWVVPSTDVVCSGDLDLWDGAAWSQPYDSDENTGMVTEFSQAPWAVFSRWGGNCNNAQTVDQKARQLCTSGCVDGLGCQAVQFVSWPDDIVEVVSCLDILVSNSP